MTLDPVQLTADLIRCPSVTPVEGGALVLLERVLSAAGFACTRVDRNGTPNLFARWGAKGAKTFGFNGHTDVVPVGDAAAWTQEPFSGAVIEGVLWGRGATDMKSGVAAFVAAAVDFVTTTPPEGAIILTITGDEEGPGKDGTLALLDWMKAEGEAMSVCLVGEPTCPETLGDMMKIGRRGSMTFYLEVEGVQGHSAYPHRAKNPLHALVELLGRMTAEPLDRGTEHFEPSTLQITTIDCGNPANNVIPAKARATVNIRFNDAHSSAKIEDWARGLIAEIEAETGTRVSLCTEVSGESFLTPPGDFVELVSRAVVSETGVVPVLSTSGGTSDARFVKDHCPVLEFGLVGKTMHQVDERIEVAQITRLKAIYARCLRDFFA
ncbi:succinyl-diaminopimelate desuccinylase [Rhodobacter capsulatus]|uniref:succinyl-diaminopimelate desuccinylase n=1 Tax=Rhodobacter capsulatus TaxID=1061 RepID=UPI0003D2D492|nr:succinyl-diaminopimelate desuccinylase [Rhodobacter capsulatus]ETD00155.1 succinyl-diaminopimelate desuccinylase [Rhodobacter capsulatus DE442]ETD74387.1 succinyl-diaminopimelate desuccinylase [Rhodobacter capsulatus R121]ETE52221.1 succinyl-diaminopimelate desuccinylase [Rhodobacter capsulatus Y262]MDS0928826.1 succinyl-diaminopimelate desuccinylase [Rhodobacter capsulatus]TQD33211.1 succinyl-diaminopimelate desuccinylase [Rhodobacter capsulatus]